MRSRLIYQLVLFFALTCAGFAQDERARFLVGDQEFSISIPSGYSNVSNDAMALELIKDSIPTKNLLLFLMIKNSNLKKLLENDISAFSEYCSIQVSSKIANRNITQAEFENLKGLIKKEALSSTFQERLKNSALKTLSSKEVIRTIKKSNYCNLGIIEETESLISIGLGAVIPYDNTQPKQSHFRFGITNFLLLRGKPIFVYYYFPLEDNSDLDTYKSQNSVFCKKLFESNSILLSENFPLPIIKETGSKKNFQSPFGNLNQIQTTLLVTTILFFSPALILVAIIFFLKLEINNTRLIVYSFFSPAIPFFILFPIYNWDSDRVLFFVFSSLKYTIFLTWGFLKLWTTFFPKKSPPDNVQIASL